MKDLATEENNLPHLIEIWRRLEPVSNKLWTENSPTAVSLMAVMEEFKGEVHRAEQMILAYQKSLREQRQVLTEEHQRCYADEIRGLKDHLGSAREREATLEDLLAKERARTDGLLKDLLTKEAENVEFHDKYLKNEAAQDEERAKKMDAFYQELSHKAANLEAHWEAKHKALEQDHQLRNEALQKRHEDLIEHFRLRAAELDAQYSKRKAELSQSHERMINDMSAREANNRTRDENLLKREQALSMREQELSDAYLRKQQELQSLKENMQREIAEVVRQYQSKTKSTGLNGGQ